MLGVGVGINPLLTVVTRVIFMIFCTIKSQHVDSNTRDEVGYTTTTVLEWIHYCQHRADSGSLVVI